ncbi:hypothetical protein Arub01_15520 [Actinomadura rubrobrunea]|uniref:DUF397 domain-containing protein n=1 Tax=Actinomadura rubrobrunea TaxID=115335 RepID=A0A9W6PUQ8_9ACTN|nr:DUF397 domain-containing protein [Actinomadura rubrobrunea]GLW63308.1 hypothetical protein Arub01_15520 [Actinomadura rubrobrunea]
MSVRWRKSSHSGVINDEACVEVAVLQQGVGLRDSKNPEAGHLPLSSTQFAALVERIKNGTLDRLHEQGRLPPALDTQQERRGRQPAISKPR